MNFCDLLIVIRCCNEPVSFVIDTYQAAQHHTSDSTDVVFAVDGDNPQFSRKLISLFGGDRVYVGSRRWGWGAGLFSLLIESYLHFRTKYNFHHFQSIDYDTLYLGGGADKMVLDHITSPEVGLLGCYRRRNEHWEAIFLRERKKFEQVFGQVPISYMPGEGVQGGMMTLTASLLYEMEKRYMFVPPFLNAKKFTHIADDHLLPIFVRMCGLDIVDVSEFACCNWKASDDPRGMEKKGVKVFHPTKLRPNNKNKSTEIEIRNYFRKKRNAPDLLT